MIARGKHSDQRNKRRRKAFSWLMVLCMIMSMFIPQFASAAAGEVPDHHKILTQNDDGTYTIAMNVTGDSEKQIQKVNVIVIVDRSGSMGESSGTGTYIPSDNNGANMYGYVDGEYVQLTRSGGPGNRSYWYYDGGWIQYTGQRYIYDSATRLEATQAAVNGLSSVLLGYNGKDGNPSDTVEMALVTFATSSTTNVSSTTSADTYANAVNGITVATGNAAGTNWEAALRQAASVDFGDKDPTYVIFFSDGSPTFYLNAQGGTAGTGYEQEPNMSNSYNAATDDAATLATKVGTKNFFTIFAYGTDVGANYMSDLTTAAGAPAENNYSASNTAELEAAFEAILESIELAGIGAVAMEDGTTSSVTTTTGEISSLLTVDEGSYKYYRAGGTNDSGDEKYDSAANGGLGEEWADAPEATFENGAVKWDLSDEGVLENDVTYTVTFDCWPSQTTLDIVADIKNDPSSYDKLDANIKKYIDENGNLKTNTTASLSYTDTRTGESNSETYVNPDPVTTTAVEQLAVSKEWENELDGQTAEPVTLTVTRDGDDHHTMTLSTDNDWTASTYISIGILRHAEDGDKTDSKGNKFEVLETGHDFTFTEPEDLAYYWELEVPTIRPMLVDGTLTMLVLKGAAPYNNPDGAVEYVIDGKTYYAGETGNASLTATNHRRARLNLTKVVDGEDADPDQTFPFTLNVVDSKASEGSADDTDSDYYVWFSIYNGGFVDGVVSGADKEMKDGEWTGYYYAPSGSDIVVNLKAGDNLRFLNLPTGSTYTFTEGTMPDNYAFTSSELTAGEDSTFSGDQETTGTIESTNMDYTVTYTNTYALSNIQITKEWEDADDQDGIRPTAEEFADYLVLKADGTDVTSTNADKLEVTDNEDGTYTAKWTGLDRYADGEEIEYTVEETAITGYTTTGTPAQDKGTITNTHTPEVTEASVKKVWEDADNQDGIRPNSLEVTLSNGQKVTLSDSNDWTAKISGLPKYANGQEIDYTWTEGSMPAGYTLTNTEKEGTVTTLTNSYTPETTEATVKKVWDDASDQDGIRPDSLTVTLSNGQTVTLNEANGWEATISNLPKNKAGQPITYTWEEGELPEGYTLTGADVDGTVTTLTNKHTPEVITIEVEKIWEDADDQDGIRPDDVTVKLLADGVDTGKTVTLSESTEWKGKFENLPKNAAGEAIEYTVEEVVPEGYEDSYDDTGYIITNTHEPAVTEATVKKVWEDADDQDGKRPDDLTVTLSDGQTVTLSESNDWTATIEGLPKYNKGQEIVYSWTEGSLPDGYSLAGTSKDGTVTTLTNKHVPEVTSVTVKKVWDDADNRDGIRPSSVKITLLANGEEAGSATLSESNNWTYTWSGVDKYSKGEEIAYTVEEDDVADYEVEVTGTAAMGYTVKNYHQAAPDRVMSDPPVQKVVTGNPATDATFTFQMKALTDGAPMPEGSEDGVKTVQITGSGSYEFGEMWYDKAGEWVYEISEVNDGIEGYTYDDTVYTLTVKVEEVADGTQVKLVKTETVEGGDGTIVFTNKYEKKPEPAPKTGDDAMTTVALLVLLASAVSIALIRKRRGAER